MNVRWVTHRVRNSIGAAQYRRVKADPLAQPRWWGWPAVSMPLAVVLAVGCIRMAYLRAWFALAAFILLFWPMWWFISLPNYRAWQKRRHPNDGE